MSEQAASSYSKEIRVSALLTPTTAAAVLFGVAVLIAVVAAVLPRCPARRRDARKVLEVLVRRRPHP